MDDADFLKHISRGLQARILAAGHWVAEGPTGAWTCSDHEAVWALACAYTLADEKAFRRGEVAAYARALRDLATAASSPAEMAHWPEKRDEALAYLSTGNTAHAPLLADEAARRGIVLTDLCQSVLANAQATRTLEAAIAGTAGRHRDAIALLGSFEAVEAYDIATGWPEL